MFKVSFPYYIGQFYDCETCSSDSANFFVARVDQSGTNVTCLARFRDIKNISPIQLYLGPEKFLISNSKR